MDRNEEQIRVDCDQSIGDICVGIYNTYMYDEIDDQPQAVQDAWAVGADIIAGTYNNS